jgi:hypothetical protein
MGLRVADSTAIQTMGEEMRLLRAIGLLLVVLVAALAGVGLGARFHDGPLGPFPGGPLRTGSLEADAVADWSFAAEQETIELQLLSQNRSRTTWILVHDGAAFIPCSLGFPPGKTWHRNAVRDGRAVVRIEGRRYPVSLERVEAAEVASGLTDVLRAKYARVPPSDAGVWYFRVTYRAS